MKAAYITTYDASNVHAWSGLGFHILKALQDAGLQTERIGGLKEGLIWGAVTKAKKIWFRSLYSQQYDRMRSPGLLRFYASQVKKRVALLDHDIIFSPGTIPIAYLETQKPIVFWTDATFSGMLGFFPAFENLCPETIKNGNKMEQEALSRCRLAIYASQWAADTAIKNYDVDREKVRVVPFGANIYNNPSLEKIERNISEKQFDSCKLLFVGVDWERKGGPKAVRVAELLNERGLRTELHIVGCSPTLDPIPNFVKIHGFVSKRTKEGRDKLEKLFSESHFFILPTQAECFGVVFAEASSFALPSLATSVGGVPTAIREGKNGFMFDLEEPGEKYCDQIERLMVSPADYKKMALSSFQEYMDRLNWDTSGQKVAGLLNELCE